MLSWADVDADNWCWNVSMYLDPGLFMLGDSPEISENLN